MSNLNGENARRVKNNDFFQIFLTTLLLATLFTRFLWLA